jgi:hypothetical protein
MYDVYLLNVCGRGVPWMIRTRSFTGLLSTVIPGGLVKTKFLIIIKILFLYFGTQSYLRQSRSKAS